MEIAAFRTKVRNWSKRPEKTDAEIDDLVNMSMHELEDSYNFRRMKKQTTGTVNSSTDYITIPSDYKNVHSLWIIDYELGTYLKLLEKIDYKMLLSLYPNNEDYPTLPEAFSTDEANSRFLLRPYPDITYDYELNYYGYSTDLSDSNTSNFWLTTNLWDLLLFKTLLVFEPYIKNLPDASQNDIAMWKAMYDSRLESAINAEIDESIKGSYRARTPNVAV